MKSRNALSYTSVVLLLICICAAPQMVLAQENGGQQATKPTTNFSSGSATTDEKSTDKKPAAITEALGLTNKEMGIIEVKKGEVKETLKQTEEETEKVKEKAGEILQEKKAIEEEVKAKEQEALNTEIKAEAVKAEAQATGDTEGQRKAKELSKEAERLKKEAEAKKVVLSEADAKVVAFQKSIEAREAEVQSLRKEINDLTMQKLAKRPLTRKLIEGGIILAAALGLFLLLQFITRAIEKSVTKKDILRESERTLRIVTFARLFYWLGSIVIFSILVCLELLNFNVNITPLLAGAGIVGLAFGFGGQYLIRDIISGFFILIEGQYRINDVVKLGDYAGLVENVNLRITTLRDLEGRVIVVPNGEIKTVVNFTKGFSFALLNIGVAYKEDVDRVMDIIKEVGQEMRKDKLFGRMILDDLHMLGVDEFADSAVMIKFRIKTIPIRQWEVGREFRRRLKNRFDELGIEIPFPHRTLYWGTGEENKWVRQLMENNAVAAAADRNQRGQ